jgi:hypothetical protein
MVDREGILVSVLAEAAFSVPNAGVVDEDVERPETVPNVPCQSLHLHQRREICLKGLDATDRIGTQRFSGLCKPLRTAAHDSYDFEARAQAARRFEADATAPTGHQGVASGSGLLAHDALLAQLSGVKGASDSAPWGGP